MADPTGPLAKLGFAQGQVVQEFGYDADVDEPLRAAVEALTGSELAEEDYGDVVDGVLVWFRDGDDDLGDLLVDAMTNLEDGGAILLLTPKSGRDGHVEPSDIAEAATVTGWHVSGTLTVAQDWTGSRLVAPKSARR